MSTIIKQRLELERSAMESAVYRGHQMTPFATLRERRYIAESVCEKCEMFVQVNARPQPNQVDISGTAIALNCPTANNNGG